MRLRNVCTALAICSALACSGDDTDTGAQAASTAGGGQSATGGAGGAGGTSSASGAGGCACEVTDGSRMAAIPCGEMQCVNGHVYACSADEMLSMPDGCTASGGSHM